MKRSGSQNAELLEIPWVTSPEEHLGRQELLFSGPSYDSDIDSSSLNSSTTFDDNTSISLTTPTTQTSDDTKGSFSDEDLMNKTSTLHYSAQERFLQFLEPRPVYPPSYSSLPPGGCPRFPVEDNFNTDDKLPRYSPAVYKVGAVARKVEWISPFQPASSRSWCNVIIELNSTQVNIYRIPSHLESFVLQSSRHDDGKILSNVEVSELFQSSFTTNKDKHFHNLFSQFGILVPSHERSVQEKNLSASFDHDYPASKAKFETQGLLIRSYSLLHAKIGLATDYCKKPNVLRLRLENEQILLHFSLAKDLIEWHLGICIGQDVAADISEREVSRYRTVPRRRRGQSSALDRPPFSYNIGSRRSRASSLPLTPSTFRSKLENVKQRFRSHSTSDALRSELRSSGAKMKVLETKPSVESVARQRGEGFLASLEGDTEDFQNLSDLHRSDEDEDDIDDDVDDEDDEDDEDEDEEDEDEDDDDGEEEIRENGEDIDGGNNGNDPQGVKVPSDDARILGSPVAGLEFGSLALANMASTRAFNEEEEKWNTAQKLESERRFLRNSIKCIKPLCFDEPWTNKTLAKATTLSSLDIYYSKIIYEDLIDSKESGHGAHCQRIFPGSTNSPIGGGKLRLRFLKSYSGRSSNTTSTPSRTPNHNLREYVVGSHLLVPKTV